MATHLCPSNPCPLCSPKAPAKAPRLIESGYVFAPYVPLVVTPTLGAGIEELPGRLLQYPVPVLGYDGVKVGDLVKIVTNDQRLEAVTSGIYLGSEEFTPRYTLNSRICIRHIFMADGIQIKLEEGVKSRVTQILNRAADAE